MAKITITIEYDDKETKVEIPVSVPAPAPYTYPTYTEPTVTDSSKCLICGRIGFSTNFSYDCSRIECPNKTQNILLG